MKACKEEYEKCKEKVCAPKFAVDDPWVNAEVIDESPPPAKPPQDKYKAMAASGEGMKYQVPMTRTAKLKKKRRKRKRSKYKKSKQRLKSKKKKKKSIRRKIRKTKKLKK